jgi:hypothetical protein
MAELDALQDVPLFGPFSPDNGLCENAKGRHLVWKRRLSYITFSITCARTILIVPQRNKTVHGLYPYSLLWHSLDTSASVTLLPLLLYSYHQVPPQQKSIYVCISQGRYHDGSLEYWSLLRVNVH